MPFGRIKPYNIRIEHSDSAMCGREETPQPMAR
jgi:hypothetical protein